MAWAVGKWVKLSWLEVPSVKLRVCTWKWISFWDGLFSGAMLVSGSVHHGAKREAFWDVLSRLKLHLGCAWGSLNFRSSQAAKVTATFEEWMTQLTEQILDGHEPQQVGEFFKCHRTKFNPFHHPLGYQLNHDWRSGGNDFCIMRPGPCSLHSCLLTWWPCGFFGPPGGLGRYKK